MDDFGNILIDFLSFEKLDQFLSMLLELEISENAQVKLIEQIQRVMISSKIKFDNQQLKKSLFVLNKYQEENLKSFKTFLT